MSLFRPLGSTIPNPVVADVANFFADEELFEFNLASPRSYALCTRYKMNLRDLNKFSVSLTDVDKVLIQNGEGMECSAITFENNDMDDVTRRIGTFLKMCRSIENLEWRHLEVNLAILTMLLETKIKNTVFGETRIHTSPMFGRFIEHNPNSVSLQKVEISNTLINDENMKLLCEADVFCSWTRDRHTYKHRETSLTDDILFHLHRGRGPSNLTGFYNKNATFEEIWKIGEGDYDTDFGTIPSNQLHEVIEHITHRAKNVKNKLKLCSWNGQKTLVFQVYFYNYAECVRHHPEWENDEMFDLCIKFAVSLVKNPREPQSRCIAVPENIVPVANLKAFEKFVDVFYDCLIRLPLRTGEFNMSTVSIFYNDKLRSGSMLKIKYKLDEQDFLSSLVRTDVTKHEANVLIGLFLKGCRSIDDLEWIGVVLDDELYDIIKPIAAGIIVKNGSTMQLKLNVSNYSELVSNQGTFFKLNPWSLTKTLATTEASMFIERDVEENIPDMYILERGEAYHRLPLIDDYLYLLGSKGNEMPRNFSVKACLTELTVKGIKAINEALSTKRADSYIYHLGTIHEDNGKDVERFTETFKCENPGNWNLSQSYKTELNGQRSCVVALRRNPVATKNKCGDKVAIIMMIFKILFKKNPVDVLMPSVAKSENDKNKDIVEKKTRKRARVHSSGEDD